MTEITIKLVVTAVMVFVLYRVWFTSNTLPRYEFWIKDAAAPSIHLPKGYEGEEFKITITYPPKPNTSDSRDGENLSGSEGTPDGRIQEPELPSQKK